MNDSQNIKVLYDSQIFTSQRFGGISRYFVELIRNMPGDIDTEVAARFSHNVYIRDVVDIPDFPAVPFKKDIVKFLNRRKSEAAIAEGCFDVFHPTYYNPYFLKNIRKPFVVTVHDMIHERFPESFSPHDPTRNDKRKLVFAADHVIAISESTKRDLLDMYGLPEDKITVVYHGRTTDNVVPEKIEGLPEHYVLFVGDRNRYKNFGRMAEAFAIVKRRYPEMKLICTGRPFGKDEHEMFRSLGIEGSVGQMFVSDGQLRYLYSNADCFVFPSLFEGFGFPVLEAFSAGCPIAMSNTSSLPEIGGDGGLYFDPLSAEDMSDKILQLIDDRTLRDKLTARGREIAGTFTWERTAAQTAEVYRSLL